jgi:hypothetical protein
MVTIAEKIEEARANASNVVGPTPRWTRMYHHPDQWGLWNTRARFVVVHSGRRSGKTEIGKRMLVKKALTYHAYPDGRMAAAAPTRDQAKAIFWEDLKKLTPSNRVVKINETELSIWLDSGVVILVLGMDKPYRTEGPPLDWILLDEYPNMKADTWDAHIRPALSTVGREGGAWFIGVPEGRNHYYRLYRDALKSKASAPEWDVFWWHSEDILSGKEIASAKGQMDPRLYEQELGGQFLSREGRVYYPFQRELQAAERLSYHPRLPLIFCFDFNNAPGVAVVLQEQEYKGSRENVAREITSAIGEVWIRKHSRTDMVCRKLIEDWHPVHGKKGKHQGEVYCYGDPTGGAQRTSGLHGSDWDIIDNMLTQVWKDDLFICRDDGPPPQKARINSMNARLMTEDRKIHLLIDPEECEHFIEDLEAVTEIEGTAGEIDKKSDLMLTHTTDAVGYYMLKEHPMHRETVYSRVFG